MKKMIMGLMILGCSFFANAQNQEKVLLEKTIQTYFDGWMTGDTIKIGKAMHLTCQLKVIKDNQVVEYDRKTYLKGFKPRPKLENTLGRIVNIDITGNVASAKCEIETPERMFTDYFNMMKLNGEWYIVDKIATNILKTK
jgi:hypothetical protein